MPRLHRRGKYVRDGVSVDSILCANSSGWHMNAHKTFFCLHNVIARVPSEPGGFAVMVKPPPEATNLQCYFGSQK